MPVVTIDWEKIKSLYAGGTYLVALTDQHIAILSSLAEQLTWEKTFRTPDYDWADKDTLDLEIADLQANLTMPVSITDLISYIDEVETLLTALVNQAGCCGQTDPTNGDWYTDPVVDGQGNVPQNIIDAGYATDASDWDGFYDYKCMIMHLWVSQVESDLRDLAPTISNGILIIGGIATILGIVATIATGGATLAISILASAATAGELSAGLLSLLDSGTEALADKIAADHDDLVCAMMEADGVEDAFNIWMDLAANYNAVEMIVLRNLNVSARLKALYAGRYDQQDIAAKMAEKGLDPADYDCTCTDPTLFTIAFDSDVESWTQFDCNMIWESDFGGSLRAIPGATSTWRWVASPSGNALVTQYSLGTGNLYIEKISIDWELVHTGTPGFNDVKFAIIEQGGTEHVVMEGDTTSDFTWNTPYTHELEPASPIMARTAQPALVFNVYRNAYTAVQKVSIKEIRVWGYVA